MKRRKLVVLFIFALAVSLIIAGCSQPAAEVEEEGNGEEAPGEVMELLMGTGGTGGTYYPLGGAIANVMSEWVEEVNVTIQATGASVENIRLLSSGEAELGMAMNNIAHSAWHDEGDFETEPVEKNWGAMGVVYPEIIQGFVAADSGIDSIADLAGKRVAVGPPGSGTEVTTRAILAAYGLSYDDIEPNFATFADAVDLFKDGHIDAAFNVLAAPAAAIQDVITVRDIKLLEITGEYLEKLQEAYPLVAPHTIPAGTYKGQDEDVQTVALQAVMYVRNDIPEDIVYKLTQAMYEGQPEIAKAYARGDQISLEKAADGVTTPFHPGAERYLKEKGVLK